MTRRSLDAVIEHTLSKWPKFQVVASPKKLTRNIFTWCPPQTIDLEEIHHFGTKNNKSNPK